MTWQIDVHDLWRSGRLMLLAIALAASHPLLAQNVPPAQLVAHASPAATTTDSATSAMRRHALKLLRPGSKVRVQTTDTLLEGTVGRFVGDSLVLEDAGSPPGAIPAASIDSLWMRHGHGETGALVGALVGAGFVGGL